MPSDHEPSPVTQSSPLISGSGRPVAPFPQPKHNIASNLNDLPRPRTSSGIIQGSAPTTSPSITTIPAYSIPPPTSAPLHTIQMRNESNRVFSSPDIGNFESSIPTRGPLNHNITMGPQRQTSGSSEVSFASSKSLPSVAMPSTPQLLSSRLPNLGSNVQPHPFTEDNSNTSRAAPSGQLGYRTRVRKVPTKEVAPDDIQAVVELGMSPFMVGQDAMHNQNRLVGNEAKLAKHVLRLQHRLSQSNSMHTKTEEDIYRMLQELSNTLFANKNMDAGAGAGAAHGPSSLRTDPDVTVYADMHTRLEHLMADVVATTLSTKLTLEHLDDRIRRLESNALTLVPPTPTPTPLLAHDTLLPGLTQMTRSGVSPEHVHRKRKRDESMANVTPPRLRSGYEHRPSSRHHHLRGQRMEESRGDTFLDDSYGPISSSHRGGGSSSNYADVDDDDDDDDDDRNNWSPPKIRMFANEALRGRDGYSNRRARLADPPSMWNTESGLEERVASGSNSQRFGGK